MDDRGIKIGITCDLRKDYLARGFSEEETAEFDTPETLSGLSEALIKAGFSVEHIGDLRHLLPRLQKGDSWDIVFNICEGMYGLAREALIPALLDEYRIPYVFSDPMVLALTLHKGATKRVVRDAGILTAPFVVASTEEEVSEVSLPYPLFVKPVAEGAGKGIAENSRVEDHCALLAKCHDIWKRFDQPALIETYLSGKDFTVSILGSGKKARVIGVTRLFPGAGTSGDFFSYMNKEELMFEYRPAEEAEGLPCGKVALDAWKVLGCRDAGRVDVRMDDQSRPHFLEVNPLPELSPKYSEITYAFAMLGHSYDDMIRMIVESALERIGRTQ